MATNKTLTIPEARDFFLKNPPYQFTITDEKGNKVTRWQAGTPENVSEKLSELDQNDVFSEGTYFVRTRTSTAKGAHNALFTVVKGNPQTVAPVALSEKPTKKEELSAVEKMGVSELLNIISENKILKFKVETLEKTIEHLNHEIDALEEQIEEGHHEKESGGMQEGLISALLPLGDRLLSIFESRMSAQPLQDMGAVAPKPVQTAPTIRPATIAPDQRIVSRPPSAAPAGTPSATPSQPPAGGAAAPDQPTDAEQIAALIIQRVEEADNDPNALADQMNALSRQRPDIYEKVAGLISQYYAQQ